MPRALALALALVTTVAARPTAAEAPAEACALVSKAEVAQIVGAAVDDPESRPGASSADVTFTQCTWASGFKSIGLGVRISKKGDSEPAYARQTMIDSGMKVEDVPGLGDTAFWTGMQLQAYRGKTHQVVVTVMGFDKAKERAVELARKALSKL